MTVSLPITINLQPLLIKKFTQINSVCNKLEAQFNFQTLTANWYGDEENILTITLYLETSETFAEQSTKLQGKQINSIEVIQFSDDVICSIAHQKLKVNCYVAITEKELLLLASQEKLLKGLIQVKLHKVLNLIAKQQCLSQI